MSVLTILSWILTSQSVITIWVLISFIFALIFKLFRGGASG